MWVGLLFVLWVDAVGGCCVVFVCWLYVGALVSSWLGVCAY